MVKVDTLIIGAGPSGLSAAYRLQSNGFDDFLILELSNEVGGLCRSIVSDNGAIFDIGGHSFHTPHVEVQRTVDSLMRRNGGMFYQPRDARILFDGHEINYPFQQNFIHLPNEELKEECLSGLEEVKDTVPDDSNLLAYLYTKFGRGVTDHFMRPYNEKLWKVNLERIIPSWTKERIADTKKSTFDKSGSRKPLESDTQVGYPSRHGFVEIFRAMADKIGRHKIRLNTRVSGIMPLDGRGILVVAHRFGVPTVIEANRVISTIQINALVKIIPNFSQRHDGAENDLFYTSMILHIAEVDEYAKGDKTPQRLYVSSDDCPAHKIAFNNLSSFEWSMSDAKAVMFETSYFGSPPTKHEINTIKTQNLAFLARHGYIKSEVPLSDTVINVPLSYPMYTKGYKGIVEDLKNDLAANKIFSIGRFGSWSYMNSDGCIHEAFTLVDELFT